MSINGNQTLTIGQQKKFQEKRRDVRIPVDVYITFTPFVTRNEVKFRTKTFHNSAIAAGQKDGS